MLRKHNEQDRSLQRSGGPQHVRLQHGMVNIKMANYSMLIEGAPSPAENTVGWRKPLQSKGYLCKVCARVRREGINEGG